jgi:hypothetical protein
MDRAKCLRCPAFRKRLQNWFPQLVKPSEDWRNIAITLIEGFERYKVS